ncbi:MAG: hypothetical protein A2Z48_10195 [Actinobacteria bacterium RBG_19FT_COMBO_70_19]|jgi:hypothetical protein|nr:MAG: hypothetical protein A2Z48_10195 [Actinobacteria bacterium RBG_19FT_COMBO_70_19]
MPEETTTEAPPETEAPAIEHDDIMQRLLRYQRQLRGDEVLPPPAEVAEQERPLIDYAAAEAPSATEAETPLMVDLTDAEAELEAATVPEPPTQEQAPAVSEPEHISAEPAPADQSARIAELEATLARITQMVGELRERFQDMAISADERLSGLEEALTEVRRSDPS